LQEVVVQVPHDSHQLLELLIVINRSGHITVVVDELSHFHSVAPDVACELTIGV